MLTYLSCAWESALACRFPFELASSHRFFEIEKLETAGVRFLAKWIGIDSKAKKKRMLSSSLEVDRSPLGDGNPKRLVLCVWLSVSMICSSVSRCTNETVWTYYDRTVVVSWLYHSVVKRQRLRMCISSQSRNSRYVTFTDSYDQLPAIYANTMNISTNRDSKI